MKRATLVKWLVAIGSVVMPLALWIKRSREKEIELQANPQPAG